MAFISSSAALLSNRSRLPFTSACRNRRLLSRTVPTMVVQKGDKIPMDVDLMILKDGAPTPVSTASVFGGKKVAMVTIPGALTSTCQNGHIPMWVKSVEDLKAKGVDDVVCLAVNDPFVMDVFEKIVDKDGKLVFLGDGGGVLTKKIGLDIDTGGFGGVRAMRGCYLVEDGVFTQVNLEEGTAFEGPSKPETLLAQI